MQQKNLDEDCSADKEYVASILPFEFTDGDAPGAPRITA